MRARASSTEIMAAGVAERASVVVMRRSYAIGANVGGRLLRQSQQREVGGHDGEHPGAEADEDALLGLAYLGA